MKRRYDKFIATHYSPGIYRVAEWYGADWESYLREEHHIGDPAWDQSLLKQPLLQAAKLKLRDIERFLSYDFAYRKIYDEHVAKLNPSDSQSDDREPDNYIKEAEGARRKGAFDRWQCTAFIVTLIDALTKHTQALEYNPSPGSNGTNIHNLNITQLAESISLVSGLSAHNIRKDLYKWRAEASDNGVERLSRVRDSLTSFGVDVDTTILDEAIARSRKNA